MANCQEVFKVQIYDEEITVMESPHAIVCFARPCILPRRKNNLKALKKESLRREWLMGLFKVTAAGTLI